MNRKGFVGDVATVLVVLFVLVVTVVSMSYFFGEINDRFQNGDSISDTGKNITGDIEARYAGVWDGIVLMVFAFLAIALVISVATLGTRPEFFFLTVVAALLFLGVAAIFANAYEAVTSTALNAASGEFTYASLIFNNLVEVTLFLLALLVLGLYVKIRGLV